MKIMKSIPILCLIILILSIGSVAASDIEDGLIADDSQIDMQHITNEHILKSSEEDSQANVETNQSETSSSEEDTNTFIDDGSFTALQKIIDYAKSGSTISLDKDYKYDEGFSTRGIKIDKDLTINGNGHTLDGLSKSRILLVRYGLIENNKVILNNIKFTNGYTDLYGGAIFNYGNLTVNNCVFTNNYAKYAGGAINSVGYINCKNSKFNKNTADGDAGALFTLSIEKSVDFYNKIYNQSTPIGDMNFIIPVLENFTIKFSKDYVSNCVFTNNVANGRGGGAIYAFSHIDIKKSTFTSNKAGEKGGAVFGNKDLYITGSKFTGNSASKYGGAVYYRCHESSGHYEGSKWISEVKYFKNLIQTSSFTKNTASKGGAIYGFKSSSSDSHSAKAVKCNFTNNKATTGRDIFGATSSNCIYNYLKLTLATVTIKKSASKLTLTAKLTKGKTLIKGKKITFTFNGKTYSAKTNSKGIAKITISKTVLKKLKVGKTIKYQAKYGSLTVKKSAKVKK